MLIYSAVLVTTIMGTHGAIMRQEDPYPTWAACVKAEQRVHQEARKHIQYSPAHTKDGKYIPKRPVPQNRITAYCRQK